MWYWGSFTQQRGFELSLGSGYLETSYGLTLQEYSDGLIRRPAAKWSAAKLRSELLDVTCHMYGLEEVDGKENSDEYAEVLNQILVLGVMFYYCSLCVEHLKRSMIIWHKVVNQALIRYLTVKSLQRQASKEVGIMSIFINISVLTESRVFIINGTFLVYFHVVSIQLFFVF